MKALLSIAMWFLFILLTVLVFLVILFFTIVLFPFDKQRKMAHIQAFWWSDALIAMNPFWKLKVRGLENIDRKKTYVIVANHQSMADIIVLYKTRLQFKWIAKESLFKIPFIGWNLSLTKHIKLTRGDFSSIKKVYREAAQMLKNNMSVLFFPEGTRGSGDKMNEFQNGAFKLAIREKKPILPISIQGTRDAIPKGSWIFKHKVCGKLTVLPAIDTSKFKAGDFTQLRDLVSAQLAAA